MTVGDRIEFSVDKLAPGGDGLAFIDGIACFIARTAPGDRGVARLSEVKRDYARAELVELTEASALRAEPACPHWAECGGCNFMHLSYEAQLTCKQVAVLESLKRVGGLERLELPVIVPSKPLGYRNRAQFHADGSGRPGYVGRDGRSVFFPKACPVLEPLLEAWLVQRAGVPGGKNQAGGKPAFGAAVKTEKRNDKGARTKDGRFTVFSPGRHGAARVYAEGTDTELALELLAHAFRFHVAGFFQSNLDMVEELIPDVVDGLGGERAADLYAGVGLFGAFLQERYGSVTCVEQDARAIGYATKNVGRPAEFAALDMEAWAASPQAQKPFAHVLVDPPRTGLGPRTRAWLLQNRPASIGYVACDPVAQARDLGELVRAGYELERFTLYDFYPQTSHIESYARLVRA